MRNFDAPDWPTEKARRGEERYVDFLPDERHILFIASEKNSFIV